MLASFGSVKILLAVKALGTSTIWDNLSLTNAGSVVMLLAALVSFFTALANPPSHSASLFCLSASLCPGSIDSFSLYVITCSLSINNPSPAAQAYIHSVKMET